MLRDTGNEGASAKVNKRSDFWLSRGQRREQNHNHAQGSGLLLLGVFLLTAVSRLHTSELDLAWRLLLIGAGIGLFSGPNQTLLMSVGTRETMGAASALSNLSTRLGSV